MLNSRRWLVGALDLLCSALAAWSLLIILTGGFSIRLPGLSVSARHLTNPLLLLVSLSALRWTLWLSFQGGFGALRDRVRRDRVVWALLLIVLLAAAARVPGLFWGYELFDVMSIPHLSPDEAHYSEAIAGRILNRQVDPRDASPPGVGAHVAVAWYLLKLLDMEGFARSRTFWFFAGRVVALLYGVATVALIYFLAREFFRDHVTALLSAYFLALSDLHVTMSHTAKQDAPATFWLYASLYAALLFSRRKKRLYLALSALAAGAAAAMKFVTVTLIPLLVAVARSPRKVYSALSVGLVTAGSFYLFGGFRDLSATIQFLDESRGLVSFLFAPPPYPRVVHVPLYLGFILLGVSLPLFLLAAYALWRALPRRPSAIRAALSDDRLPLVLALAVAFLQISLLRIPSPHYALTLIPFAAMLAARGFQALRRCFSGRLDPAPLLLGAVTLYLLAHVGSVQFYFIRDTREIAGEWIRRNVPPTETLSVSAYVFVPPEYRTTPYLDQNYLVLHEDGYRRYLVRHNLHYKFTGRFPEHREIYNPDAKFGHYPRIPQIFRGELPYRLVKEVRLEFLTPELRLAKFLELTPLHLGDTLIFRRVTATEGTGSGGGR